MKKKKDFRPEDFRYEPTEPPRLPIWMHQIEKPLHSRVPAGWFIVTAIAIAVLLLIGGIILYGFTGGGYES